MAVASTLAYYDMATITTVKSFIALATEVYFASQAQPNAIHYNCLAEPSLAWSNIK
jgi:hypothetical protein